MSIKRRYENAPPADNNSDRSINETGTCLGKNTLPKKGMVYRMSKRRSYRFSSGLNGVDRFYYPYRFTPPELGGARYLDISPEMLGQDLMFSDTDPNGMYTGVTEDDYDRPVQDVDDL